MKNQELAKILHQIGQYLEMEGVAFKPYAYEKAAIGLETIEQDVEEIYKKGGMKALEEIPGVGKNIAEKIEEYLKTGKIKNYENLKKKFPLNLEELATVEGMGFKKIKILYQKLGIKNLKDLEKACKEHRIAPIFGFGEKTEKNILQGIAFLKRSKEKFLLDEILRVVRKIEAVFKNLKEVKKIDVCGSVRRRKEIIGDVDFLVLTKDFRERDKIMDFFCSLPGVLKVWGKGATKSSVRMKQGFDMDIRIVPEKSYGSALQYFTGSKEHNIVLRKIAMSKGLKLSEYGLFKKIKNLPRSRNFVSLRGQKSPKESLRDPTGQAKVIETQGKWVQIAGENEEGIYKALEMQWIPPELRENQGEIEKAKENNLPKLITLKEIKGDLHCHSHWGAGKRLIKETAEKAIEMGYEYIGISDHTKFLKIEHGLDEKQLEQQRKEIDKINLQLTTNNLQLRILQGCEANILNDGSLDISDKALAKLDYVIAGVHSQMKMPKEKITERIIKAMKNPNVDIISHPTGRILMRREEYQIDFDKILRAAKEYNVVLEINACPVRLDLNSQNIRKAKNAGVKMIINTDAHQINQLYFMEFGVSQARRGWAEKEDIINTYSLEKLLNFFKKF